MKYPTIVTPKNGNHRERVHLSFSRGNFFGKDTFFQDLKNVVFHVFNFSLKKL